MVTTVRVYLSVYIKSGGYVAPLLKAVLFYLEHDTMMHQNHILFRYFSNVKKKTKKLKI